MIVNVTLLASFVPAVTVTTFPLIEHVADAVSADVQLNVPLLLFSVISNVILFGYVTLPVFADSLTLPLAFVIVIVLLSVTVIYPFLVI